MMIDHFFIYIPIIYYLISYPVTLHFYCVVILLLCLPPKLEALRDKECFLHLGISLAFSDAAFR